MKLSVCMIVKNEEAMIGTCLQSIKDADEIIILDTGSTDETEKVVNQFRIFQDLTNILYIKNAYKWNDNFAEARNKALEYATGDWVLTIDADEQIEQGGIAKIKRELHVLDDGHTYAININVMSIDGKSKHVFPRLHIRSKLVYWKNAIHNYLCVAGEKYLDVCIVYDYSPAHKQDPDRALRILKKEVYVHANNIPRNLFYLGREYMYRKDYIQALYWFDRYITSNKGSGQELAEVYLQASICLWNLQRLEDAKNYCMKAIVINANFKEAIILMAKLSFARNETRWTEFAKTATDENVLFVRT